MKKLIFLFALSCLSLSVFAETIPESKLGRSLSCYPFTRANTFAKIHNQDFFTLVENGDELNNIKITEVVLHGDILCIYGKKYNMEYAVYFDLNDSSFFAVDKRETGEDKWEQVILCDQPVYDPPIFF